MGKKKYYIAYGSNLNRAQMKQRCPTAKVIGTSVIKDYELRYCGSCYCGFLTIEPKEGSQVPVAVWDVTETDEHRLDRYEADFYRKDLMVLPVQRPSGKVQLIAGFIYIMQPGYVLAPPTYSYKQACLEGYRDFGFDERYLAEAEMMADVIGGD